MKKNSIKQSFIYILSLLAVVSCLQEERSPEDILIPSPAQVDCSASSFSLTSKVPNGSEKLVDECGFLVGTAKDMADAVTVEGTMTANSFAAELPMRKYGATYYICSYVTNGHGSEIRSDVSSFEMLSLDKYVDFGKVVLLSYDASSRQASIVIDADIWAGVKVSETGVCYGYEPSSLNIDGDHKTGAYNGDKQTDTGMLAVILDDFSDATQYYLRPYVKDGDYISYGDVLSLYIPAAAKVSTFDAEAITASGATLSGEVTDECGSAVTERGFVWIEGDAVPAIEDSHIAAGSGLGAMTATVEGLQPNKKYTFRAYATNASGTAYGEAKVFTTLVALPSLLTSTISNITSTSATFNGVLANDGGESVSEVGFYYSTEKEVNPEIAQKVSLEYSTYQKSAKELSANTLYSAMQSAQKAAPDEGETFSIDVYSLGIKTKYYVKSYAVNSAGVAYGSVVNFETAGEIATIKTVGSSEVTTSSAVLSANITTDNGEKITERGFVWMEGSGNPTTDNEKLKVVGETGEYTATLSELKPNVKYSFRAYAINSEGTAYGEVKSFTTKVDKPEVSVPVISSVTSTSATFTANVKYHGGETVSEVGFYYSTDQDVNLETSTKITLPYSSDMFSTDISGLIVNKKYYVKAYAKNSAGIFYSESSDFITSSSYPEVATLSVSDITSESAVLYAAIVNDNGEPITERGFVWLKGEGIPSVELFKLKVEGTDIDFSTILTGLEPNQKYSFRAYAINSKGTAYGEIMSFLTAPALPELSSVDITDISSTSALLTSSVTNHGGDVVDEVGFYYSIDSSVDPETSMKVSQKYAKDLFSAQISELSIHTKYYVKSYAINAAGTAYGETVSFTTLASTPEVTTSGSSDVTSTSALLSGSVVTDNGSGITERGFVWLSGTDSPTISSNKLKVDGTIGEFSATLDELQPNNIYSFSTYAINQVGVSYGEVKFFKTLVDLPEVVLLEVRDITSSSADLCAKILSYGGEIVTKVGFLYGETSELDPSSSLRVESDYKTDEFLCALTGLSRAKDYYICPFATNSAGTFYGAVSKFTTLPELPVVVTLDVTDIDNDSAVSGGVITDDGGSAIVSKGVVWDTTPAPVVESSAKTTDESEGSTYSVNMLDLEPGTTYYVRAYATNALGTGYGELKEFSTKGFSAATDLANEGTANSYIISEAGSYYFPPVQGNSWNSVGNVASVDVLWESFGTSTAPSAGDLIQEVSYQDGFIYFKTAETFQEGNAVIAAKDASGIVLWSWHIWFTDKPQEHIYEYDAGTLMDRNLGATSATPGDVGALGLLYQWGRKDPFLGSSSITEAVRAESTIEWPEMVSITSVPESIEYSIKNPTTYISLLYADIYDDTRWQKTKTIYDPCPVGWKVADKEVWYSPVFKETQKYISRNSGMAFTNNGISLWYPSAGVDFSGTFEFAGGGYWTAAPVMYDGLFFGIMATGIGFSDSEDFMFSFIPIEAGMSIRCQKEGTGIDIDKMKNNAVALSVSGTANSYIVSENGIYSFPAVKGNSSEYIDHIASIEVLWESLGTEDKTRCGDLIQYVFNEDRVIYIKTSDVFREGNAVVAAKNMEGDILWSWHIWFTDVPQEQVYANNAGTMMDRNLGATSATPGDVGALGLLYQWGRKDPFLGSSSISSNTVAKSTLTWPSTVSSDSTNGTIEYAVEHPTTFISDWLDDPDAKRWQSKKTINDPCPAGWRVPDAGANSIWSISGVSWGEKEERAEGVNVNNNGITMWYPFSGYTDRSGYIDWVGYFGQYWTSTSSGYNNQSYYFSFENDDDLFKLSRNAYALSVRCQKEGTGYDKVDINTYDAINLSADGPANSYIVTESGTFAFSAVKGNSYESVGSVSSVRVLWESFGTGEEPFIGDLVKGSLYEDGTIYFKTSDVYREGNAVIAALDENGIILWSWHLWFTDQPQEHVYRNNAGTMMDRNLGATSATPGEEGTLGLLYQWGRKDPFLSYSYHLGEYGQAASTVNGPQFVSSTPSYGTMDYATKNPTTFICGNGEDDWIYDSPNNTLWQSSKTMYDPCPTGWRVPDGGPDGVWNTAAVEGEYNTDYKGFLVNYAPSSAAWYPIAGYYGLDWGTVDLIGGPLVDFGGDGYSYIGGYWSATSYDPYSFSLEVDASYFLEETYDPSNSMSDSSTSRYIGYSVRCMKEGTGGGLPEGGGAPGLGEPEISVSDADNLSDNGTANSYVVSAAGTYSFPAVKGNSSESVGSVSGVEVLWESFGTAVTPSVGDLVKMVLYENGQIYFKTADAFKEGNAVIAAKDASGTILWSWHIWLTDEPEGQVYYNNAGTMMDRNLGATSATPGDVGALGLLYQWGRKDPFLGSSSISSDVEAKSTITWPSAVSSDSSNGTIAYAVEHPTTYITITDNSNGDNFDWYYTGSSSTDDTRWQSDKTIYDPCPSGWRVPDGGSNGVWNVAGFSYTTYDDTNEGISFSISSPSTTWYPASGCRSFVGGALYDVGYDGGYWSVTPDGYHAYDLYFNRNGYVFPTYSYYRAGGFSVRCLQESE